MGPRFLFLDPFGLPLPLFFMAVCTQFSVVDNPITNQIPKYDSNVVISKSIAKNINATTTATTRHNNLICGLVIV